MLDLDLARLDREGRLSIEGEVLPDDPLWRGQDMRLKGPLHVHGSAQRAGPDVFVRLHFRGEVVILCGRCLREVTRVVEEEAGLLFRAGADAREAEAEEVYPLPERARSIDLGGPLREHVLLAVPRYAICHETCRGMCPRCGADLNERDCGCQTEEVDERWAALRRVRFD